MPIGFRAASGDANSTSNTSPFVAITPPAGLKEFDFLVAAITIVGGAAITATPPAGWTLLNRVDPGSGICSLAVYWKWARPGSEPPNWVWSIGSDNLHSGVVVAYSGVDLFCPIEASGGAAVVSLSATFTFPTITPSVNGTTMLAFIGCSSGPITVTPVVNFTERAIKSRTGGTTTEVADGFRALAGAVGSFSATLSGGQIGSAFLMCLRPSVGLHSLDEVRGNLIDLLPPGARDWMDLEPGGDWFRWYEADAIAIKKWGSDLGDALRFEQNALTAVQKLPDFEKWLGLPGTGTAPQRQARIVSRARESGSLSKADIQAVLGPLLGYANPANLVLEECSRSALTTLHTYSPSALNSAIAAMGNAVNTIYVGDDGYVSQAGAQILLSLTTTNLEQLNCVVTSPAPSGYVAQVGVITMTNGSEVVTGIASGGYAPKLLQLQPGMQISIDLSTWYTIQSIVNDSTLILSAPFAGTTSTNQPYVARPGQVYAYAFPYGCFGSGSATATALRLFLPSAANCAPGGNWTITINSNGAAGATIISCALFVEGVGFVPLGTSPAPVTEGLGAEYFKWAVLVDPALAGAVATPDYVAAAAALARLSPSHTKAFLAFKMVNTNTNATVDDANCIVDQCIVG